MFKDILPLSGAKRKRKRTPWPENVPARLPGADNPGGSTRRPAQDAALFPPEGYPGAGNEVKKTIERGI